jgi:hypothetical protein
MCTNEHPTALGLGTVVSVEQSADDRGAHVMIDGQAVL